MSYEVRVWSEDGTLMGYAEVKGTAIEYFDIPPESGYAWSDFTFTAPYEAEAYAREWADGYADWCRETCPCGHEDGDCGVIHEHGISIEYCRGGWATNAQG